MALKETFSSFFHCAGICGRCLKNSPKTNHSSTIKLQSHIHSLLFFVKARHSTTWQQETKERGLLFSLSPHKQGRIMSIGDNQGVFINYTLGVCICICPKKDLGTQPTTKMYIKRALNCRSYSLDSRPHQHPKHLNPKSLNYKPLNPPTTTYPRRNLLGPKWGFLYTCRI